MVPFVHSLSYRPIKVHLVPNNLLLGTPWDTPKDPWGSPDHNLRTNDVCACVCVCVVWCPVCRHVCTGPEQPAV